MNLEHQLQYCTICQNRKMDRSIGIVCGLTNEKPNFLLKCPEFIQDKKETQRKLQLELNAAGDVQTDHNSSPKYITYSGVAALIIGVSLLPVGIKTGGSIIVTGILLIIKGDKQKEIIEKHKEFEDNLNR